jgi:hypothetical protein
LNGTDSFWFQGKDLFWGGADPRTRNPVEIGAQRLQTSDSEVGFSIETDCFLVGLLIASDCFSVDWSIEADLVGLLLEPGCFCVEGLVDDKGFWDSLSFKTDGLRVAGNTVDWVDFN